jgi:hypothetical protein
MSANIGNGWRIVHETDRVIELRKDDATYRRITGRDGYVLVRGDPSVGRRELVGKAIALAQQNDARVAEIVASQIMPKHVTRYHDRQRELAGAFGVPGQEPSERVYRP